MGRFVQQACCAGVGHSLGAAPYPQFLIGLAVVPFDCIQRKKKLIGNLLVGQPGSDETQNFQLTFRQWLIAYLPFVTHDSGIPAR